MEWDGAEGREGKGGERRGGERRGGKGGFPKSKSKILDPPLRQSIQIPPDAEHRTRPSLCFLKRTEIRTFVSLSELKPNYRKS